MVENGHDGHNDVFVAELAERVRTADAATPLNDLFERLHTSQYGYRAGDRKDYLDIMALAREHGLDHKLDGMAEYIRSIEASSTRELPEFQAAGTAVDHPDVEPPVSVMDSRIQDGEVFDTVRGFAGFVFHRRRDGVYPDTPGVMRFQANRVLTDADIQRFAGLVGYAYRAEVRGEPMGAPFRDSPYSFTIGTDMTKSQSDDLGMALECFEESLHGMVAEGSPERKTDRAGEGTRGTRLVEGFGELKFDTYYDDVVFTQ